MASGEYNVCKVRRFNGGVDFDTDTIKIMLVKDTYTFNPDHATISALKTPTDYEISGTGYSAGPGGTGRKTLASVTVTQDDTNDRAILDAADLVWTALNAGTVGAMVLYKHTSGSDDTLNIPLIFIDHANVLTDGTDFTEQFDPVGVAVQP